MPSVIGERHVRIPADAVTLEGGCAVPAGAPGIVVFAHGSGSSRFSPRNTYVAETIRQAGLGTLLFDLLTAREDVDDETRFDIGLLSRRLIAATSWLQGEYPGGRLKIGYFGASTGAAAALEAAAELGTAVAAIVSRGGRPDLAAGALTRVTAPTLLIVGARDTGVVELNRQAYERLTGERELAIVPGATHLFEEPGALAAVARLAAGWFTRHLASHGGRSEA